MSMGSIGGTTIAGRGAAEARHVSFSLRFFLGFLFPPGERQDRSIGDQARIMMCSKRR